MKNGTGNHAAPDAKTSAEFRSAVKRNESSLRRLIARCAAMVSGADRVIRSLGDGVVRRVNDGDKGGDDGSR